MEKVKQYSRMARVPRKTKQTAVTIVVADSHQKKTGEVLKALRAAGLQGAKSQRSVGTITGRLDDKKKVTRSRLAKVPGVEAVEEEQSFQLPPKDADVQ